jgi:tripartite-type tricarboxylate transporter receptor subunit TctC
MSRKNFLGMAIISLFFLLPQFVGAQGYPNKSVEIICPYSAGSSFDINARLVAEIGGKHLGRPMVVTNKTGAAGGTAAAEVIAARPDGYKIIEMGQDFFGLHLHAKYPLILMS